MLSINKTKSYIKLGLYVTFYANKYWFIYNKQDKLREQFLKISLKFYVVYS